MRLSSSSGGVGGGGQVVVMVKQCSGEHQTRDTLGAHSIFGNAAGGAAYFPFSYCSRPRSEHRHSKIPPMIRPQFEEIF